MRPNRLAALAICATLWSRASGTPNEIAPCEEHAIAAD